MNIAQKLKRWFKRRALPSALTGEPIVIGHAMIETDPDSSRFGKKIKRVSKRGTRSRRIIVDVVRNGYNHQYHATKGWRCVREG